MTEVGSLRGELTLDSREWIDALAESRRSFASFAQEVGSQAKQLQRSVRDFGIKMTAAVTVPSAIFARAAVKTASDAEELQSAFNQTFKHMAADMNAWAVATGDAMGRSTQEMQQGAARFGLLFNQAAKTRGEAAELSKTFSVLAQDLSSFFNTTPDEALTALMSGLSGEAEPMRRYGVFLSDVAMQQEMLRLGIKGTTQDLSEQQKIMLRANIILANTRDAQKDVIRTSDSLANRQRALAAAWLEMKVELGTALMPIAKAMTAALTQMLDAFTRLPAGVQKAVMIFGAFMAALGPLTLVLATIVGPTLIALAIRQFGVWGRVIAFIIAPVASLVAELGGLALWIGKIAAKAGTMGALGGIFRALTGPIGLAVSAFLLFKDEVLGALGGVWAYAKETLGPPLFALFTNLGNLFSQLANGPIGQAVGALIGFLGQLRDVIGSVVGNLLYNAGELIVNLLATVVKAVSDFVAAISALLSGDFAGAWKGAVSAVANFGQGIVNALSTAFPALSGLFQGIYDLLSGIVQFLGWVLGKIGEFVNGVISFFGSMLGPIFNAVRSVYNSISEWLYARFGWVYKGVRAIAMSIVDLWNWVKQQLGLGLGPAITGIARGVGQIGDTFGAAAAGAAVGAASMPAAPKPAPAPRASRGGGRGRGGSGGGGSNGADEAEERARLALRKQEFALEQQLAAARAREDHDETRRIEQQLERIKLVQRYRDLKLGTADAEIAADRDLRDLRAAEEVTRTRNLAIMEEAKDLQVAQLNDDHTMVRQLEEQEERRAMIARYQREGVSAAEAELKAIGAINQIEAARADAAARRLRDDEAGRQIGLAKLRGDTAQERALVRADDIRRRAERLEKDSEGRIKPEDARARAEAEWAEEEEARQVGHWRSIFRDGMHAAMNGDMMSWLKDRWTDLWSRALEESINMVADLLRDLLKNALANAGGGEGGGGWFGSLLGGLGKLVGLGSGFGSGLIPSDGAPPGFSAGPINIDDFTRSFGGLPKLAGGGTIKGLTGVDRNLLSLNGNPVAWVSRGEQLDVRPLNDNGGRRSRVEIVPSPYFDVVVDGRAAGVAAPMAAAAEYGGSGRAQASLARRAARRLP